MWINDYTAKNSIINSSGEIVKVNYMFSITPDNPVLELFYGIIPHQYWYMYLSFAVISLYLVAVYFKDIIRLVRKNRDRA